MSKDVLKKIKHEFGFLVVLDGARALHINWLGVH